MDTCEGDFRVSGPSPPGPGACSALHVARTSPRHGSCAPCLPGLGELPHPPVHELLWLSGGGTGLLGSGWLRARRRAGSPASRLRQLSPLALESLAQPCDPSPFGLESRGSQVCSSGGVSILGLPATDRGARCRTGCGRLGLGKRPQEGPAWHSGTASTAGSGRVPCGREVILAAPHFPKWALTYLPLGWHGGHVQRNPQW